LGKEFREVVKQINFLSMTTKEFQAGPGFSSLLTHAEAFTILTCLLDADKIGSYYPEGFHRGAMEQTQSSIKQTLGPRIYFDIQNIYSKPMGRLIIELQTDVTPKAYEKFRARLKSFKGEVIYYYTKHDESGFSIVRNAYQLVNILNRSMLNSTTLEAFLSEEFRNLSSENAFYISLKTTTSIPSDNSNILVGRVVEGLHLFENGLSRYNNFQNEVLQIINCGEL